MRFNLLLLFFFILFSAYLGANKYRPKLNPINGGSLNIYTCDIQCKSCFYNLLEMAVHCKSEIPNLKLVVTILSCADLLQRKEKELQILKLYPSVDSVRFISSDCYSTYEEYSAISKSSLAAFKEFNKCPAAIVTNSAGQQLHYSYLMLFDETTVKPNIVTQTLAFLGMEQ